MMRTLVIVLCAVAMTAALIVFIDETWLLTAVLGALGVIMLISHRSWNTTAVFCAVLLICIPTEIILVRFGVWSYPHETFAGIPLWIAFVWSNMVLVFIRFKVVLDARLAKGR